MPDHTMRQYDVELENIRSRVLQMGGYVEQQVVQALEGLLHGDIAVIDTVIANDRKVNEIEVSIDDDCAQIIVRRQPAANDLRSVLAVSKVVNDLERVGDEAKKIAKVARLIYGQDYAARPRVQLKHLGDMAVGQLRKALDALARLDVDAAAEVVKDDKDLDAEFKAVMRQLVTFMMEDPRTISHGIDTLFAAKAMERIGDHAKNVAQHTVFLVRGRDVRHFGATEIMKEVGYPDES